MFYPIPFDNHFSNCQIIGLLLSQSIFYPDFYGMAKKDQQYPKSKPGFHPGNKHQGQYHFDLLIKSLPELSSFITKNKHGKQSIDFFNPEAVKLLNKALLKQHYQLDYWDIPAGYLCPPIPGRADYIHHIAEHLSKYNNGKIPTGKNIHCLDIGTGANCIYPIIGFKEYGWSFTGSDIDPKSIKSAKNIISKNPGLGKGIQIKHQPDSKNIFTNIIKKGTYFDLTVCNPPFHTSQEEATKGTLRKLNNLQKQKATQPDRNFGGADNELWCKGGEKKFVTDMIRESKNFATSCFWFSTLVSKEANLNIFHKTLEATKARDFKTIPMHYGNKKSRILTWTFLTPEQQKAWVAFRWS